MMTHLIIALWKFPECLLYQVCLCLPKHRLELITKICWRVHKAKYKKKLRGNIDKVLSGQELSRLFQAIKPEKFRVLFRIQYIQALRPCEVLTFRIDKIYWEKGTAEIGTVETSGDLIG